MKIDPHILTLAFGVVALMVLFMLARTLRTWHRSPKTGDSYDVHDLFMENGKASKGAFVMMGAFAATTWFFIYYAVAGKMTEGYFIGYLGGWVTPVVARMISGSPSGGGSSETVVTASATTTTTPATPAKGGKLT